MVKKKTVNYLNNDDMVKAIIEWQAACKIAKKNGTEEPRQSDYIGRCILLICNGLGSKGNFAGYSYRQEMVGDAIEWCTNAVKSFDPTRVGPKTGKTNNAFNYLTMVAYHAMQRRINIERKQNATKHKNYQHQHFIEEAGVVRTINDMNSKDWSNNEVSNRTIAEFEEKYMNPAPKKKLKKAKA